MMRLLRVWEARQSAAGADDRHHDTVLVASDEWQWDASLYSGSAAYYVQGRVAYPRELADRLTTELELDGSGRLLDVGCGPGSLTLLLVDKFESVTGVDADQDMLVEASQMARRRAVTNAHWLCMRAEDLPAELGTFRVASFAQSFHWMNRAQVASTVQGMLEDDGRLVHVHATTHEGAASETVLPFPRPPHSAVTELKRRYLGSHRRAGQGTLPDETPSDEAAVYLAAGFTSPVRIEVPGQLITRTVDDIVAATFSLSSAAPHLFGDRAAAFETDLRNLLLDASPRGLFSEQMREIVADIWRP